MASSKAGISGSRDCSFPPGCQGEAEEVGDVWKKGGDANMIRKHLSRKTTNLPLAVHWDCVLEVLTNRKFVVWTMAMVAFLSGFLFTACSLKAQTSEARPRLLTGRGGDSAHAQSKQALPCSCVEIMVFQNPKVHGTPLLKTGNICFTELYTVAALPPHSQCTLEVTDAVREGACVGGGTNVMWAHEEKGKWICTQSQYYPKRPQSEQVQSTKKATRSR